MQVYIRKEIEDINPKIYSAIAISKCFGCTFRHECMHLNSYLNRRKKIRSENNAVDSGPYVLPATPKGSACNLLRPY